MTTGVGAQTPYSTMDRETREAFIEAFWTHFSEDSTDADKSFDKLSSIVPEVLARHNQEEFSNGLGNSTTNLTPQTHHQEIPYAIYHHH